MTKTVAPIFYSWRHCRGAVQLAIKIDHGAANAQQRACVGQVFQPQDRRPRTQFTIRWRQIERHLEHRLAAQRVGVVAVLVARRDH